MIQAGEIVVVSAVSVCWRLGIPMGCEIHKVKGCAHVGEPLLVGGLGIMEGCRIDIEVANDDDAAQGAVLDDGV